jgi:hypothetical protein
MEKYMIDGYIVGVSIQENDTNTEEYNRIKKAIDEKPIAPEGYTYKLKDNLEWELCKKEPSGGM